MAPELDPNLLQRLHHLLRQQTDLSERLDKAPRVVRIAEANVANYEDKVATYKEAIRATKMKADQKQLQLSEREDHIEKLTTQRNSCESNREFQLLNDQIAADHQANQVLQDEILEQLEKVDMLEAELAQSQDNLATLKLEVERVRRESASTIEVLQRDLNDVVKDISQSQALLPPDVRAEVIRLAKVLGEGALAKVEDRTCGHCMKIINTQTFSQLTMRRTVFCGSCGSLLYLMNAVVTSE